MHVMYIIYFSRAIFFSFLIKRCFFLLNSQSISSFEDVVELKADFNQTQLTITKTTEGSNTVPITLVSQHPSSTHTMGVNLINLLIKDVVCYR